MDMFRLDGEVGFVTGAGSGIGQAIAVGMASAGADVMCFDLPGSPGIAGTVRDIEAVGRKALVLEGDVTVEGVVEKALAAGEEKLGPLTLAVNAAGIANASPAEDMTYEQWKRMLDVDLNGVFLSCRAEGNLMLGRRRGSILNIASISGMIFNRGLTQIHYNSAKAAVIHLTRSLAVEWCTRGVRVNALSPGYTLTPMNLRPEVKDQRRLLESDTPMERMAEVREMVGPAIFLLGNAASFCIGVNLVVDGGVTCW